MHILKKELIIDQPLDKVFDYFNTPVNLSTLMPPIMGFKLLTPQPITMKEGAVFDYTVTFLGIPMRWTSLISDYDPPHKFVDIQLKGPNSYWHHQHIFEAINEDQTKIIDHVHYMLPLGLLGKFANFIFMQHIVRYLFYYRTKVVTSLF